MYIHICTYIRVHIHMCRKIHTYTHVLMSNCVQWFFPSPAMLMRDKFNLYSPVVKTTGPWTGEAIHPQPPLAVMDICFSLCVAHRPLLNENHNMSFGFKTKSNSRIKRATLYETVVNRLFKINIWKLSILFCS